MKLSNVLLLLTGFLLLSNTTSAQDPTRFQNEIDALTSKVFEIDSSKKTVVFTGSSSIRMWHDIQEYYPHINAINTGFGGSHTSDLQFYLDELVLKHKPDKIFVYEGDNDIAAGKSRIQIIPEMNDLIKAIQEELPNAEIYFISPKPSIARWSFKDEYELFNRTFSISLKYTDGVTFIDVWNPMLNEEGKPMPDIFLEDNLHMNEKGYEIWGKIIGEYLD